MPSIVDVPSDQLEPHERRIARIAHEESSFNADHYMLAITDMNIENKIIQLIEQIIWKTIKFR